MLWILDHQRDVAADLRVFAHVSWREALAWPGPELLALAHRLPVYNGAVAAAARRQAESSDRPSDEPASMAELMADPDSRVIASFGRG